MFSMGDIVVQIGGVSRWIVISVYRNFYRAQRVGDFTIAIFDRKNMDRTYVKVDDWNFTSGKENDYED